MDQRRFSVENQQIDVLGFTISKDNHRAQPFQ